MDTRMMKGKLLWKMIFAFYLVVSTLWINVPSASAASFKVPGDVGVTNPDLMSATLTGSFNYAASIAASNILPTVDPLSAGTAHITASAGGVTSNQATPMVTTVTLTSIRLTPVNASIFVNKTQQFTAIGHFADGSTLDITTFPITWNNDNTGAVFINNSGLATGNSVGTAHISVTAGSITSNQVTLTVALSMLQSIAVTPDTVSLLTGHTQQFTAIGTYTDGSTADITYFVTLNWNSDNNTVATVSSGLATGLSTGTAHITASVSTITSNQVTVNVTNEFLTSINISVALQGGSRTDEGWVVPLTVKFFDNSTRVSGALLYTFIENTTKSGSTAIATVSGITPGTYDISAVTPHCLTNVKRGVVTYAPTTSVNLGTLLEGNADSNDAVNITDFGILAASYGKSTGDPGYDARADFDRSGIVNITDFGLLAANYGKSAPIVIP